MLSETLLIYFLFLPAKTKVSGKQGFFIFCSLICCKLLHQELAQSVCTRNMYWMTNIPLYVTENKAKPTRALGNQSTERTHTHTHTGCFQKMRCFIINIYYCHLLREWKMYHPKICQNGILIILSEKHWRIYSFRKDDLTCLFLHAASGEVSSGIGILSSQG